MASTVVGLLRITRRRKERLERLRQLGNELDAARSLVEVVHGDSVLTLSVRGDDFPTRTEINEIKGILEDRLLLHRQASGFRTSKKGYHGRRMAGTEDSVTSMLKEIEEPGLWKKLRRESQKGSVWRCCVVWMIYTHEKGLLIINSPESDSVSFSAGNWEAGRPSNQRYSFGKHFTLQGRGDTRTLEKEISALELELREEQPLVERNHKELVDRVLRAPDSVEIHSKGAQCLLDRFLFLKGKEKAKDASIWITGLDPMMRERIWCRRCVDAAFKESQEYWGLRNESFAPLEYDGGKPVCLRDRCSGRELPESDIISHDEVLKIGFTHLRGTSRIIESFAVEGGISMQDNEKFRKGFGVGLVIDGRIEITQ